MAVAVTPMTEAGDIDVDSLHRLMDFYVNAGATGVALLGVMGEANRMTDAESEHVIRESLQALNGRIPAIVGVSDPSLRRLRHLTDTAMSAGAAGILVQPLKGIAGDVAVANYFATVAEAVGSDVPICVQDYPKASGVHMSVEAWRMILERCPSVVMLKHEDEPSLPKLSAIRRAEESGGLRRAVLMVGNNGIHLPQELGRGADGAMTGFAFPDVLAAVCSLYAEGKAQEAEDLFDLYLPVNRYELQLGVSVRKEILRRRGVISSAAARHPAKPLDETGSRELDNLLERIEKRTGQPISALYATAVSR